MVVEEKGSGSESHKNCSEWAGIVSGLWTGREKV